MEENKAPAVIEIPKGDFHELDIIKIKDFIEQGLPGIARVDDVKMMKIIDLYLSGKTYTQISNILGFPKNIILYLSYKFKWNEAKQEYIADLEKSMMGRLMEAKIVNQDFLIQMTQFWQKRIGSNITKYWATGNDEYAEKIDGKDVDRYLKIVDVLQRIATEPRTGNDKSPAVGLNLGDGVTIVKNTNGSVEITPKQTKMADLLKQFADQRREEEKN